jgi:hypothetical protein
MPITMADPYLKAMRSKEHLDSLREGLRSFREDNPIRLLRHDDIENQRYCIRYEIKSVPDKLHLIVGDFLYCLRSSLDQLVWTLAKLTLPYPEGTQFPIQRKADSNRFNEQTAGTRRGGCHY